MVYVPTCREDHYCLCWKPVRLHDALYWITWIMTYLWFVNYLLECRAVAWFQCLFCTWKYEVVVHYCHGVTCVYWNIVAYFVWRSSVKYCSYQIIFVVNIFPVVWCMKTVKKEIVHVMHYRIPIYISELEHLEFECRCSALHIKRNKWLK
jgi:hypothetical protein